MGQGVAGGVRSRTWKFVGAACSFILLAALVSAYFLGIRVYVVTGASMVPAIQPGAIIVTKTVPAGQLRVGDVVTLQRTPEARVVTHRVVEVTASTPSNRDASVSRDPLPEARLVLQGDSNDSPDPSAYHVTSVQLYLFTVFS